MKKFVFAMLLLVVPVTVGANYWHHITMHIDNQLDFDVNVGVDGGIFSIPANGSMDFWNNNRGQYVFTVGFRDFHHITSAKKFRIVLHSNPTRQRGETTGSLAGASGWSTTFFVAGVIDDGSMQLGMEKAIHS